MTDYFGSMVFSENVMREYIPEEELNEWRRCVRERTVLPVHVAEKIADGMKQWALEKGATHYTHWFQPLTGMTAEKHEGFMVPGENGSYCQVFSYKELTRGEPDASSFPSGGLRSTFEARGYSAWDPTSYAFIKDRTLCIPTVFLSYSGEALDKKTPLLRSCEVLNTQVLRVLRLIGDQETERVSPQIGAEQEYFLVPKDLYSERPDLVLCGCTLLGAPSPKSQELDGHYYGAIKPAIRSYMQDLDEELWKLGICSKTEHNEAAPAQYEMAPFFSGANQANDQNQLTMEIMHKVAERHGLVCLLSEKPFAGVNGSGKHVNWSIQTDKGVNLLSPGKTQEENSRFLLFLAAFLQGVDEYQELIRCSAAYAGNDKRIGGNEAPPAVISAFVGTDLEQAIDAIIDNKQGRKIADKTMLHVDEILLRLPKDNTDRNRTSPIAFTGNKFEFRMPGASQSIASPVTYLNVIMAEELKKIADELEKSKDMEKDLPALIRKTLKEHRRILFCGNGYDKAWIEEAEKRGLKNLKNTAETIPEYTSEKNIRLLTSNGIYTRNEMESRNQIHIEKYCSITLIEAKTMAGMIRKDILGAVSSYTAEMSMRAQYEKAVADEIITLGDSLWDALKMLEKETEKAEKEEINEKKLTACSNRIIPAMNVCREIADKLEERIDRRFWPYPTYTDFLFSL